MGIILSLLIGILIIQLAIRIPPDKRTILRISIGILMFSEELFNQFYMVKIVCGILAHHCRFTMWYYWFVICHDDD